MADPILDAIAREAIADLLLRIADRRARVMSKLEFMQLEAAAAELRAVARVQPDEGASRQAEDEDTKPSTDLADSRLREAGIAVRVGSFVPGGVAVRLDVGELSRWLQPDEAHELSLVLESAAIAALHEDRAARHAAHAARTGFGS